MLNKDDKKKLVWLYKTFNRNVKEQLSTAEIILNLRRKYGFYLSIDELINIANKRKKEYNGDEK